MFWAVTIGCWVVAFLLGSIPCGVVIGKAFFGVDPRSGGSGSIGATNSSRMLGAKGGAAVLVLDMLKGAAAVGVARALCVFAFNLAVGSFEYDMMVFGAVFFGIAGHIFSPWLGFKGGKGISTGFGTLCTADWRIGIGLIVVFLIFAVATRIVSVGSMCAAFSVFVQALVFHGGSVPAVAFSCVIAALVIWAHRSNLGRLIRHEEPKFSLNKGPKKDQEGKDE